MPDLKIVIGGDAKGLQDELKKSQAELAKTAVAAQKTDSSLQMLNKSGGQSMFNLTEKIRSLQSSVFTEKDRGKIAAFNAELKATEAELAKLNNLGTTGGSGLGAVGKGASDAFGAVRKLAYVLPGIGIAGIFSILGDALLKAATATEALSYKQQILSDVFKSAAKEASGDYTRIELLSAKLNDLNISQSDRIKYAKEYNSIAADGNKIDLTQINNLDLINAKITQQIKLIETRALAKAAEAKLSEQAQKVIDAEFDVAQYEKFKNARKLNSEDLKDANTKDQQEQQQNLQQNQKTNSDALVQHSRYLNAVAGQNKDALEGQKKYNAASLTLAKEKAEFDRQARVVLPLLNTDSFADKTKALKVKSIVIEPEVLYVKFKNNLDLYFEDEENLRNALAKGLHDILSTPTAGTRVFDMAIDINPKLSGFTEVGIAALRKNAIDALHKHGLNTADRKLENGLTIKIPIEIATLKELWAQMDQVKEKLKRLAEDIKQTVGDTITNAFSSLGDALANTALGKGNFFGNVFGALLKSLGDGVRTLGVQVIAASELIAAAKAALKVGSISGVGAGLALVVLGSLISAAASQIQGVKGFASGTTNFQGGGVALVGERGPERIFLPNRSRVQPNNELQAYSGGGGFIAEANFPMDRFVIAFKKAEARMSRNGTIASYGI